MKCFCSLSLEGILNAIFAQHHSHRRHRRRRRRRSETKANRILFFMILFLHSTRRRSASDINKNDKILYVSFLCYCLKHFHIARISTKVYDV
jgi:hypothetical protein